MDRISILQLIVDVLRETLATQANRADITDIGEDLSLIGASALLDSMAFVMLTAGIEQQLSEKHNLCVTIVNEKAMSMRHSPFRTVGTLTDYVFQLTQEVAR